jgi:inner membrane protein
MGEAFAGRELGKKAMLWGALAQSIPDIDFVATAWLDTAPNLLAHRGFTHSFLCCALMAGLLALLAERWHRPHNIRLGKWALFFGAVIFVHIFLDAFNNYGVGWLEPFSHRRFSFNAIYVADPFFSIGPLIGCAMLLYTKRWLPKRKKWWRLGLALPALYLTYCVANKVQMDNAVKAALQQQQIAHTRYFSTPAPLQNWLWYVVAGTDSGYHVGFRSVFDRQPTMDFQYFPRNDSLLRPVLDHTDLHQLIRFSQQFYTVEKWNDTLVFNDLRFGQVVGWDRPREKFVFHYFLQDPGGNDLVVQRGRFAGWNWATFQSLLKRIRGN